MTKDHPDAAQRENYCGMTRVDCMVADLIRGHELVHVNSSKTDLSGEYGEPEIYTEWSVTLKDGTAKVVMREHKWPSQTGNYTDRYRCEHYVRAFR